MVVVVGVYQRIPRGQDFDNQGGGQSNDWILGITPLPYLGLFI